METIAVCLDVHRLRCLLSGLSAVVEGDIAADLNDHSPPEFLETSSNASHGLGKGLGAHGRAFD